MGMMEEITKLSHEFGTDLYVKSGGGNTSAKDETSLWIKPSGTVLLDMQPDSFVGLDRKILMDALDNCTSEDQGKEGVFMEPAILPGQTGRPSVESPIHNLFDQTYVVHNHPPVINGMTCAMDGRAVCAELFPDALWIDFVDPGISLWTTVQAELNGYRDKRGALPDVVMIQNHGIFIASDEPDSVRKMFGGIMGKLEGIYREKGIGLDIEIGSEPDTDTSSGIAVILKDILGEDAEYVVSKGPFNVAEGPLTPDHIVYERPHKCLGAISAETIADFEKTRSYRPRVFSCDTGVFATGSSERQAGDAMALAVDGAQIKQYAAAFGGVRYLSDREAAYIDGWEVEKYRRGVS